VMLLSPRSVRVLSFDNGPKTPAMKVFQGDGSIFLLLS
jgi:hypothetical protein